MRVRKAGTADQGGRRIKARFASIARGAEDEGFGCARCGLVLAVTRTEAANRAALFECPFCGGHSVPARDLVEGGPMAAIATAGKVVKRPAGAESNADRPSSANKVG